MLISKCKELKLTQKGILGLLALWLRLLSARTYDGSSVPITTSRGSQLPPTPAPGAPAFYPALRRYLHTGIATHRQIHKWN